MLPHIVRGIIVFVIWVLFGWYLDGDINLSRLGSGLFVGIVSAITSYFVERFVQRLKK